MAKIVIIYLIVQVLAMPVAVGIKYYVQKSAQPIQQTQETQPIQQVQRGNSFGDGSQNEIQDWKNFNSSNDSSILPMISFKYPPEFAEFVVYGSRNYNKPEFVTEDWVGVIESKGLIQFEIFKKSNIFLEDFVQQNKNNFPAIKYFSIIGGNRAVRLRCIPPAPSRDDRCSVIYYGIELSGQNLLVIIASESFGDSIRGDLEKFGFIDDKKGFSILDKIITTLTLAQ